ncbi:MAG: UDP-N-acetylmuramoyl-tripeptide--D-alanyl-D-alanine ligase [bacterium]
MRFDQLTVMTGGTLYNSDRAEQMFTGVSIDSRTLESGQLFIALRGVRHDGHDFISQAVAKGAGGVMVEFSYPQLNRIRSDVAVVAVEDSHQAMIRLAREYRQSGRARFVAITGSNGKTTTKELSFHLLNAVTAGVYRSSGNLNNLYGAPLALLAMPRETQMAVMELGISTPGEMTSLAAIVEPDVIVITNVGPSHLEFLDSVESVARAKLELVQAAADTVPVIVNADDRILIEQVRRLRSNLTTFAIDGQADFRPQSFTTEDGGTRVTIDGDSFHLPLRGRHQVYNLLAAYAAVRVLGFDFDGVDTGSLTLTTMPMRGQLVTRGGITFYADCYNANPDSVKAAVETFFEIPCGGRRIVVMGDMLELGTAGAAYHREIGRLLARHDFALAVFVGPLSRQTMQEVLAAGVSPEVVRHYHNAGEAAAAVPACLSPGDMVLVKASRGIGLEAVIAAVNDSGEVS